MIANRRCVKCSMADATRVGLRSCCLRFGSGRSGWVWEAGALIRCGGDRPKPSLDDMARKKGW